MKLGIALIASFAFASSARAAAPAIDFTKDIKPILEHNCVKCHGATRAQSGFRLDSATALAAGGKSGKAVMPGKAAQSGLFKRISAPKNDPLRMPQEAEPLSAQQIAAIRDWINQGAKWPSGVTLTAKVAESPAAGTTGENGFPITPAESAAVQKLEQAGVLTMRLAQNINYLRADFSLRGKPVTDAELALLKNMPNLVELSLANTDLTDAGTVHLKTLKNLTRLQLQNTKITDAALANFKGLEKLTSLNLYGTQVTDKGLDQLAGLKNLHDLYVWQTKVTVDGAKKLAAAIPDVTINLGYEVPPVRSPKPQTAAEKPAADKK